MPSSLHSVARAASKCTKPPVINSHHWSILFQQLSFTSAHAPAPIHQLSATPGGGIRRPSFHSTSTGSNPFTIPIPQFSMSSPNSAPKMKILPAHSPLFQSNSTRNDPISTHSHHPSATQVRAPTLKFRQPCHELEHLCYNRS